MVTPSHETHYRCRYHKWILKEECSDSDIGILCPICLGERRRTRVRTRPKHSNHAGDYITALKEATVVVI